MSNAKFYSEWLGVEKNQFRILSLLAPTGEFRGNLTDMCRSLNISPQTRTRNKLKDDIAELAAGGYIMNEQLGRTYTLTAIPKETVIEIPTEWLDQIISHNYTSESVSWQAVLKVLLWIIKNNNKPIVTRSDIAATINIGVDTISSAFNVLEKDFNAITRQAIIKEFGEDKFRCIGLELTPAAWWKQKRITFFFTQLFSNYMREKVILLSFFVNTSPLIFNYLWWVLLIRYKAANAALSNK